MKKIVIGIFIIMLFIIILPLNSAQQQNNNLLEIFTDIGNNFDKLCLGDICTTTIYSYEKYFNRNGQWEEIDESWHECTEGFCTNRYNFGVTATLEGVMATQANNQEFTAQLTSIFNQQASFSPQIEGNLLTYKNILAGVDITYQYFPNKLKETIILGQPIAASAGNNQIIFSTAGNIQASFEEPYACDNADNCINLEYAENGSMLMLAIPNSFLNTAAYPITIDPTIVFNDSYIAWDGRVRKQGTTYTRNSNPSTFRLGNTSVSETAFGTIDWNASALALEGTIVNMTLQVYVENSGSNQYILSKNMEKNSFLYANDNSGNMLFYEDMSNGTIYANTTAGVGAAYKNLSFSDSSLSALQEKLESEILSTGLEVNTSSSINISARSHSNPSRRPVLIVETVVNMYNFTYDANGNLISGFNKYFEYDSFNTLRRIRDTNATGRLNVDYYYSYDKKRVKKVVYGINGTGHNQTHYYTNTRPIDFVYVRNTNGTVYNETFIYLYDKMIARIDNNGRKFFYHPDHLGSTSLVTNESGDVVENISYLPFGDVLAGQAISRHLYNNKELDRESELLYYGARYYDPEFARFLAPDPVIQDVYNPQNLNRYSYVLNNPYKYVDPSGNYAILIGPVLNGAIGMPIGPDLYIGAGGQIGTGLAISYVPGEGVQIGAFNINALGSAAGGKVGLTIASISPDKDTSLSDLHSTERVSSVGGGDFVVGSLSFNDQRDLTSIDAGFGGGLSVSDYIQRTIIDIVYDSNKKDTGLATDPRSGKVKPAVDDGLFNQQQSLLEIKQAPQEEGSGKKNKNAGGLTGSGSNGNGNQQSGQSPSSSSGGCGPFMRCL